MNARLKKLNNQVIMITGATSGIGLVTARMAVKRSGATSPCRAEPGSLAATDG